MTELEESSFQTPLVPETDPRVQLATERTLLAWIRTGFALMAFGFVVARFALLLQTLGVKTSESLTWTATAIGIVMILIGAISNAGAAWHYRQYFLRIRRRQETPFTAWSLAVWVAVASAVIGLSLIVYLLLVESITTGSRSILEQ
jgi:putative membrane protein